MTTNFYASNLKNVLVFNSKKERDTAPGTMPLNTTEAKQQAASGENIKDLEFFVSSDISVSKVPGCIGVLLHKVKGVTAGKAKPPLTLHSISTRPGVCPVTLYEGSDRYHVHYKHRTDSFTSESEAIERFSDYKRDQLTTSNPMG